MNDTDKTFLREDIGHALSLLTRLPVRTDHESAAFRAAAATWAYPIVGAIVGGLAGLSAKLALFLGAPEGMSAAIALAALVLLTGALHEDGLADCADGMGGGGDPERRLAIMKDSRIGAFGAAALTIALIARWSGLSVLAETGQLFWTLVAVGAVSRLPMVLAMFLITPARPTGLSSAVGLPPPASVGAAIGLAIVLAFLACGTTAIPLLFWSFLICLPLFWLAQRLLGGQTGDVLGASQQLSEIAGLAVVAAAVT